MRLGSPVIFDVVYDACTYKTRGKDVSQALKTPQRTSVLLTCRLAYFETSRILYDMTHFYLILLAGRARPTDRDSTKNVQRD